MYIKTVVLSIFFGLALVIMASAQSRPSFNDSLGMRLELRWLEADFQRAEIFNQMEKYKLGTLQHPPADSVFYPAWKQYERLFAKLPANWKPVFFTDAFYTATIPVAQFFRNAAIVSALMEHHSALHPKPAVADPKHHDDGHPGHHHHQ